MRINTNNIVITGEDAKHFILKREKQLENVDNRTLLEEKQIENKRRNLINAYKSVQKYVK